MKIEQRNLSEIKPYPGNPRQNNQAVDAVAASIRQYGFRQPLVVDAEGMIICGHTRYFYCIGLSAWMELPSRQTVTCLMVIKSCQLVALKPTLAFSLDSSWCVASAGATQNLGETFADLWNRDCRCPFFFPAVPLARETKWQSAKA